MRSKQKKQLFTTVIIIVLLLGLFIASIKYSDYQSKQKFEQKIALQKEQEPQLLSQAKPAFESELNLIIPDMLRVTRAPYDGALQVRYAQNLGRNHDFVYQECTG
jgi:hypothetical protein